MPPASINLATTPGELAKLRVEYWPIGAYIDNAIHVFFSATGGSLMSEPERLRAHQQRVTGGARACSSRSL